MTRFAALALAGTIWLAAADAAAQQAHDTTVDLNAAEKHVAEPVYRGARGIAIGGTDAGGWQLHAGASIEARSIDLTLRNVRGSIAVRADASRLDALVRRRREAAFGSLR